MTVKPQHRPSDLVDQLVDVKRRLRALSTGSPGVKVLPGGYGRNRAWAKTSLVPPAAMTVSAASLRWRVTSDRLLLTTHLGGLLLADFWAAEGSRRAFARIGAHGRPSTLSYFYGRQAGATCILTVDAEGHIRYVEGPRTAAAITFFASVPLA